MVGLVSVKVIYHRTNYIVKHKPWKFCSRQISNNSENTIIIKKLNKVMTIGINRPEVCNALNYETTKKLMDAVSELEEDDSSLVGVIYGLAGNFSSGFDLKEMKLDPDKTDKLRKLRLTEKWVSKPLVAAISGHAVGFGLDLALWCDLRIMEETAVIGCLQRRLGVPMSAVAIDRLRSMIGLSRSLDWLLTGRPVKVEEAFNCGLVTRPVACGTGLGQAFSLAMAVAKFPAGALLADRATLYRKTEQINTQQLRQEAMEGAEKFFQGYGRHGKNTGLFKKGSDLELGMDH